MEEGKQNISISAGTMVKAIAVGGIAWMFYIVRDIVLVTLTAVVIASAIEPITRKLSSYRIPRIVSVILIFLAFIAFFSVIFYIFAPPLFEELSNFIVALPEYIGFIEGFDSLFDSILGAQNIFSDFSSGLVVPENLTDIPRMIFNFSGGALQSAASIFGGFTSFALIMVLSFYLAVQDRGVESFLRVVTPIKHEKYILGLWERTQNKIALWMQGQLLLGVIIGVLVYLGLTILGVPYAFLLALIAAFFELIPIFGPIMAAVPAVILAFVSGGASLGLMTIGLYVIIQQFENHLIYPLVVRKVVGVSPILVILSLVVGFKLAGFLGVLLSVPFTTFLVEFTSDIEKRKAALAGKG